MSITDTKAAARLMLGGMFFLHVSGTIVTFLPVVLHHYTNGRKIQFPNSRVLASNVLLILRIFLVPDVKIYKSNLSKNKMAPR